MTWMSIARQQAGLVSRAQLVAAAVPRGTCDGWVRSGRLERTRADGVYRVGGSAANEWTAAWFAALSTGSPVSYLTAAAWWEMPVPLDGFVHVTRFDRRRLDWPHCVRVHRVALAPADVVEHRGLLVTKRTVTALDCIGWLSPGRALTFADRAVQQRWLRAEDIARRLNEAPGRWGNRQLRRVLTTLERGAEAESERRLHRLLRDAGIGGWVAQHPVATPAGRFRVDIAFPRLRLVVEVDGYAYHRDDGRFQNDRTRSNALLAAGWHTLRFTWEDIVDRPQYVVAQISSLLAA